MQKSKPYKEQRTNSKDVKRKMKKSNSRVQLRIRIKKHGVKSIWKKILIKS